LESAEVVHRSVQPTLKVTVPLGGPALVSALLVTLAD
jgi:hypothetical protein